MPKTALRLYSNGAALTPEKSDRLRELKVNRLFISLNTIDKERYERVVGLPLERTMENLEYLAGYRRPKGFHRPVAERIVVRLTLTPESTASELDDFRKMCRRMRVKSMAVGLFNYKGDIHSTLPVPSYPCEHIDRLDIMANGETTLCCMDHEGNYGWGSVVDNSVLDVFNNKKACFIRDGHRKGKRKEISPCSECNLFWPSFSGMGFPVKIANGLRFLHYYLKNKPNSPKLFKKNIHS